MRIITCLIKDIFGLDELKYSDIYSKDTIIEHRKVIEKNRFLNNVYRFYYAIFRDALICCPKDGLIMEVGSGAGFIKDVIPDIITSDIIQNSGFDIVFDAQKFPFENDKFRAIFLLDVLHHLKDTEKFFFEAERCLKIGGRLIIIEPYVSPFSRIIYKYLHHEGFDEEQKDWPLKDTGLLSEGNSALPSIIFFRDRRIFIEKFKRLKLESVRPYTIFLYHISGGLSLKSFVPSFMFKPLCKLEQLMLCFGKYLSTMFIIEIVKI